MHLVFMVRSPALYLSSRARFLGPRYHPLVKAVPLAFRIVTATVTAAIVQGNGSASARVGGKGRRAASLNATEVAATTAAAVFVTAQVKSACVKQGSRGTIAVSRDYFLKANPSLWR